MTGLENYLANHTLTSFVGHTYDANNRLILRSHDADGYYGTIADTTRTLYIQEMGQIELELEKAGSWADFEAEDLTHRYLWGPGANNLLVDEAVSDLFDAEENELRWGLTDHLGTVRDWIDSSGTLLDHAEYDSFGRRLDTPAIDAAFGFTGALVDEDTGLQNHWNRWYDTATGSWISVDPIKDGVNWYGYVGNSPTLWVDPDGLSAIGKAGKEIIEALIKRGVKRKWFQIHHIVGQELFDSHKTIGPWLKKLGVDRNCAENLMALPTKIGKKNNFLGDAAKHNGKHVKEYIADVTDRLVAIMNRHKAGSISDDIARELIEKEQRELREGLLSGTIQLGREEYDALMINGGAVSIAGLLVVVSTETADAAIASAEHDYIMKEMHDCFTASGHLGDDSWTGFSIDLFNPVEDLIILSEIAEMTGANEALRRNTYNGWYSAGPGAAPGMAYPSRPDGYGHYFHKMYIEWWWD